MSTTQSEVLDNKGTKKFKRNIEGRKLLLRQYRYWNYEKNF